MTIFDRDKLQHLESEGLLRSTRHPDADLWIYNYTARCQYGRQWTPETLACRGLILDADGHVVARPFAKFFNLGEPGAPKLPTSDYTVTEKMDGSLMIYYELDGEPRIASRGSFTSDQAVKGMELLREHRLESKPGTTPLFELIAPWNRIVVDYGDREDLILLDCIDNPTGTSYPGWPGWSGETVKRHYLTGDLRELRKAARPNTEGYVVSWENGAKRVKIKHDEYVRLHRIVSVLTEHRVWEACRAGDDLTALEGLPDETYGFIDTTSKQILKEIEDLRRNATRVVDAAPTVPRKELAAYFFDSDANPHLCFTLYDGRDITSQLWKIVEPKATP